MEDVDSVCVPLKRDISDEDETCVSPFDTSNICECCVKLLRDMYDTDGSCVELLRDVYDEEDGRWLTICGDVCCVKWLRNVYGLDESCVDL